MFFKGTQIWRYTSVAQPVLMSGYPKAVSSVFPGLTGNFDDVITWNTYAYFIQGTQIWKVSRSGYSIFATFPLAISDVFPGVPGSPSAIFESPYDGNANNGYFLYGTQVYYYAGSPVSAVATDSPLPMCCSCRNGDSVTSTGVTGTIAPFSYNTYTSQQRCNYTFAFPTPGKIRINFLTMDTEANFDFVSVIDRTSSTLVSKFSGSSLPAGNPFMVTAASPAPAQVTVAFNSDYSVVKTGFSFTWTYYIQCPAQSPISFGAWSPSAAVGYQNDFRNASCNAGYSFTAGSASRVCLTSGLWSGNAAQVCSPLPCLTSLVAPVNGTVSSTTGSTGSTSTFGCNQGYTLTGTAARTCLSDRTWSDSADQSCAANACSPSLVAPTNGAVSSASGTTLSVSTFSCSAGYTLTGTASRQCLPTGSWSGLADQVCAGNPCSPSLVLPAHGNVSCTAGTTGSVCTYSCNVGYTLSAGSTARTCQSSGSWTGVIAVCSPVPCDLVLSAPTFGSVNITTGTYGMIAGFACNFGYSLSGTAARFCQDSGVWSGAADQVCGPGSCGPLAAPTNGSVSPATGVIGVTASYGCDEGFTLSGNSARTCQASLVWSGSVPICTPQPCVALPALPHGTIMQGGGLVGDTATFVCDPGYTLSGAATRYCPASLNWTGSAGQRCDLTAIYCPTQSAPTAGTVSGAANQSLSSIVSFACNAGFSLSGSVQRTCDEPGVWTGNYPVCSSCFANCIACAGPICSSCSAGYNISSNCTAPLQNFCPVLAPPAHGSLPACSQAFSASCGPATCNAGYYQTGSATRTCSQTNTWTGTNATCATCSAQCASCVTSAGNCIACAAGFLGPPLCTSRVPCAVVLSPPTDGFLSTTTGFFETNATYTCAAGFALSGLGWRFCNSSGGWTGTDPVCLGLPCALTLTPPALGSVAPTTGVTGSVATYSCNAGYSVAGSATRTCQPDGAWSGTEPTCAPNPCPTLVAPPNGGLTQLTGTTGSSSSALCDAGYALAGDATRFCLATGVWNGTAPSCVGIACTETLEAPINGTISQTTGVTGEVATFGCNAGFALSGDASRTCQANQLWSGLDSQMCGPIFCSPLNEPAPTNGRKTCEGLSLGQACVFSCNFGYSATGTTVRACQSNFAWSGAADVRCSAAVANATVSDQPLARSVVAGTAYSFTAALYTDDLVAVTTGEDLVRWSQFPSLLPEIASPPGVYSPLSLNYTVSATAPTVAGSYARRLVVNTVSTGVAYTLTALPGPTLGSNCLASGPALAAGVLDEQSTLDVLARDAYSNPQAATGDVVVATVKVVDEVRAFTGVYLGGGVYRVTFAPWRGGAFTISVQVNQFSVLNSPWLVFVLSHCLPGQYAVEQTGPCEICPASHYSTDFNVPACTACPKGTFTLTTGATSVQNCSCQPGFYTLGSGGVACDPCPEGASCAGGSALPKALPGYYPSRDPAVFLPCNADAAPCLADGKCRAGYKGRLCADCVKRYYKIGAICYKCATVASRLIILVFAVGIFLFVAVLVRINTRDAKIYGLAAFMIGFNALQITALYGDIAIGWPRVATLLYSALSSLNLNVDLASPECSFAIGNPWMFKYFVTLAIPILVIIPFAFTYAVARLYIFLVERYGEGFRERHPTWAEVTGRGERPSLGTRLKRRIGRLLCESIVKPKALLAACGRAYAQMIVLCFMPLCRVTLRFFACTRTRDGVWVMTDNPTANCYTAAYWSLSWTAAIGALGYCIGIPVAVTLLLRRKRAVMPETRFLLTYGFLVARFRHSFYLFEPLGIMSQKFLVVLAATVFASASLKALWAGFVMFIAAVQLAYAGPYVQSWHNLMATICVSSGSMALWGALIQFSTVARDMLVLGALLLLLLTVVIGIAYDVIVVARRDREDEKALDAAGVFVAGGSTGRAGDHRFTIDMEESLEMNSLAHDRLRNPVFSGDALYSSTDSHVASSVAPRFSTLTPDAGAGASDSDSASAAPNSVNFTGLPTQPPMVPMPPAMPSIPGPPAGPPPMSVPPPPPV